MGAAGHSRGGPRCPLLGVGEAAYAYVGGFMGSRAHGAAERAAYG